MEDRKQRLIEELEQENLRLEGSGWVGCATVESNVNLIEFLKVGKVPFEYIEAYKDFIEDPETFYSDYLN